MNMDMLSRVFDILQRVGGMEQIGRFMMVAYGVVCVFGILNCFLGYRILRFWMMIFGFIIGAGAGFGVTYLSGVQDKMVIAGAMAGLGIVLAIVSFLIYRAGIFVLGFGIGISLSIYLVHPTSSFSFFLCILVGVGLGALAMRYAKGVIIIGTSVLGGVLAGFSLAKIGGLEQFPYGAGLALGIALLGMLIQFAINRDHYEDEEDEEEDEEEDDRIKEDGRKRKSSGDADRRASRSEEDYGREERYAGRREPSSERSKRRAGRDRNGRSESRSENRRGDSSSESRWNGRSGRSADRSSSLENRRRTSGSSDRSRRNRSSGYSPDRRSRGAARSSYDEGEEYDACRTYSDADYRETSDTYEDFEKSQRRKRQLDVENMTEFDLDDPDLMDDLDEWEDN